jgi:hypothetical protein
VVVKDSASATCGAALTLSTPTTYVGSCTINNELAGEAVTAAYDVDGLDTNYTQSTSNGLTVQVASQTILFTSAIPASPTVGTNYDVTATGGQSNNPVIFSIDASSTAGACTLSGTAVSFVTIGICVIDANQAANSSYLAAPQVQQTVIINTLGPQAISFTSVIPTSPTVGNTYIVAATGGKSNNPVTFTIDASSTAGACTISSTSITFGAVGTCIVDANQAGSTNYLAAPQAQQTVTINTLGVQTITFTSLATSPNVGTTYVVAATGGKSNNPVTFTIDPSSTAGVCTISIATVTFVAVGTCIVDANQAANSNYLVAPQVQQKVTVLAIGSKPPVTTKPTTSKIVINLHSFVKSGPTFHELVKLTCELATCRGVVKSIGAITIVKDVSVKSGPWTITKKVAKTTTVVLAGTSYRLAAGKHELLTLALTASGRSVLAEVKRSTPLREALTATVKGGLTATKSLILR